MICTSITQTLITMTYSRNAGAARLITLAAPAIDPAGSFTAAWWGEEHDLLLLTDLRKQIHAPRRQPLVLDFSSHPWGNSGER